MSDAKRPLGFIGAAIVCLLAVGVVFRSYHSSSSDEVVDQDADRVAVASGRSGWSAQDGGAAAASRSGGVQAGSQKPGGGGKLADGGGSAATVREQLRRSSQQAAAAVASGPSVKIDSGAPIDVGSSRNPFPNTRARIAGETNNEPGLTGAAPVALDANGNPIPAYRAGETHVFDTESETAIPDGGAMTGSAGSIAFEVKPGWVSGDGTGATFFGLGSHEPAENRIDLVKNGDMLRFVMRDSRGNENAIGVLIRDWQPDQSHPIAVTWGGDENGQKMMSLYVDGALVDQRPYEYDFNVRSDQALVVGNKADRNRGARSLLGGFQVYNYALDAARIGNLSFGEQP